MKRQVVRWSLGVFGVVCILLMPTLLVSGGWPLDVPTYLKSGEMFRRADVPWSAFWLLFIPLTIVGALCLRFSVRKAKHVKQ